MINFIVYLFLFWLVMLQVSSFRSLLLISESHSRFTIWEGQFPSQASFSKKEKGKASKVRGRKEMLARGRAHAYFYKGFRPLVSHAPIVLLTHHPVKRIVKENGIKICKTVSRQKVIYSSVLWLFLLLTYVGFAQLYLSDPNAKFYDEFGTFYQICKVVGIILASKKLAKRQPQSFPSFSCSRGGGQPLLPVTSRQISASCPR